MTSSLCLSQNLVVFEAAVLIVRCNYFENVTCTAAAERLRPPLIVEVTSCCLRTSSSPERQSSRTRVLACIGTRDNKVIDRRKGRPVVLLTDAVELCVRPGQAFCCLWRTHVLALKAR